MGLATALEPTIDGGIVFESGMLVEVRGLALAELENVLMSIVEGCSTTVDMSIIVEGRSPTTEDDMPAIMDDDKPSIVDARLIEVGGPMSDIEASSIPVE